MDSYYTIKAQSEGIYKEKGSKFIALSFNVSNEQEIKDVLSQLRKDYFDARHHCYAYCLGEDAKIYRANDDGEPNHSAGDPILGQIKSKNLTNILVVVVRYFGGTKLGVGGLISAYKNAAKDALDNAFIVEKHWYSNFTFRKKYTEYSKIMSLIKEYDATIVNQEYLGDEVEIVIEIRKSLLLKLKEQL